MANVTPRESGNRGARGWDLWRAGGWVAVACAYANAAATAGLLVMIRPGSPAGGEPPARLAYLAAHPGRWIAGWTLWIVAAITLLLFYVVLALTLNARHRTLAWMGVTLAAVGLVPDVGTEILSMLIPPHLAEVAARPDSASLDRLLMGDQLLRIDARVAILNGFVANGLYSLGGLLLNGIAFDTTGFPRWLAWSGLPVWAAGLALAAASLLRNTQAMVVATGVVLPLFILWTYGVASLYLWRPSGISSTTPPPANDTPCLP